MLQVPWCRFVFGCEIRFWQRTTGLIVSIVILLLGVSGCHSQPAAANIARHDARAPQQPHPTQVTPQFDRYVYTQIHMGVQTRLILYAPNEPLAKAAARKAFARIAQLESVMSDYRADSELSQLCAAQSETWIPVSDDLFRILQIARTWAARSDGALDMTLGPLTKLWRQARHEGVMPSAETIAHARERTGWRFVELRKRDRAVRLLHSGMELDLGAVGKGFAADEALKTLAKMGIHRALVEIGGDIALGDGPPSRTDEDQRNTQKNGSLWNVAIETGYGAAPHPRIRAANLGIATSGDTEQYIQIEGSHYSHILDPATGLGLTTRSAATAVAQTGASADAVASIVCVLGPERAAAFVCQTERRYEPLGVRMVVDGRVFRFGSLAAYVEAPGDELD